MPQYLVTRLGVFRSTSDNGQLVKTYVHYGKEHNTVSIVRLAYGREMDGWVVIKEFKGKYLYREEMHFRLESFMEVNNLVSKYLNWCAKTVNAL